MISESLLSLQDLSCVYLHGDPNLFFQPNQKLLEESPSSIKSFCMHSCQTKDEPKSLLHHELNLNQSENT